MRAAPVSPSRSLLGVSSPCPRRVWAAAERGEPQTRRGAARKPPLCRERPGSEATPCLWLMSPGRHGAGGAASGTGLPAGLRALGAVPAKRGRCQSGGGVSMQSRPRGWRQAPCWPGFRLRCCRAAIKEAAWRRGAVSRRCSARLECR